MGGWAALVVTVLWVLAAVHSQQETRLEDPTAEYYVRLIMTLLANTTHSLENAITRVEGSAAKEASVTDLQDSLRDVKESVGSLDWIINDIRNSVDNGVNRTRMEIRMFRDHVSEELADLRHLLEDKDKDKDKDVNHQVSQHTWIYPT